MNRALIETVRPFLPKRLKLHRIWRGPLRGQQIFTSWHDYPGAIQGVAEAPLLEWFGTNIGVGETWLDVGGHYGYTAMEMCRLVGPEGRVFVFEPVLASCGAIAITRQCNGLPQMRIMPFALAANPGINCFDLPIGRGMADSTISSDWRETLLATSFDSIWPSICGTDVQVHGVKIDVQGMEIETLRGMRELLKRNRPKLVLEFHEGVDRRVAIDLLEALGYGRIALPIDGGPQGEFRDNQSYAFASRQSG